MTADDEHETQGVREDLAAYGWDDPPPPAPPGERPWYKREPPRREPPPLVPEDVAAMEIPVRVIVQFHRLRDCTDHADAEAKLRRHLSGALKPDKRHTALFVRKRPGCWTLRFHAPGGGMHVLTFSRTKISYYGVSAPPKAKKAPGA